MKRYAKKLGFGRWNGSGGLYGTRRQVAEARRLIRGALKGHVAQLRFLDERLLNLAERFTTPYRWLTGMDLTRTLELLRPLFGLMKGVPTDQPMLSCYWRKKTPMPAEPDPDRDHCGLLWIAPIAPAEGESVRQLADIIEHTVLEFGFEPMIAMTMLTERSMASVVAIIYDRDVPGEDQRAMNCFNQLRSRLAAKGYYPYRLGTQDMDLLDADPARKAFLSTIKRAIDPNDVLSPGHYVAALTGGNGRP
jgi:4-cresol dehydrogenase (hydroxylating)